MCCTAITLTAKFYLSSRVGAKVVWRRQLLTLRFFRRIRGKVLLTLRFVVCRFRGGVLLTLRFYRLSLPRWGTVDDEVCRLSLRGGVLLTLTFVVRRFRGGVLLTSRFVRRFRGGVLLTSRFVRRLRGGVSRTQKLRSLCWESRTLYEVNPFKPRIGRHVTLHASPAVT